MRLTCESESESCGWPHPTRGSSAQGKMQSFPGEGNSAWPEALELGLGVASRLGLDTSSSGFKPACCFLHCQLSSLA